MEEKGTIWENLKGQYKNLKNRLLDFISHRGEGQNTGTQENGHKDRKKAKNALAALMVFSMLAMGFTGYKVNEVRTRAFDLYINEVKIGSVRDGDSVEELVQELEEELSDKHDLDMILGEKIQKEASHVKEKDLSSKEELKSSIKSTANFLVAGTAIRIDNKEVGVLSCNEDAEALVEKVKEHHLEKLSGDRKLEEVKIVEEVDFEKKEVPLRELSNEEELIDHILNGGEEVKTHIIEVGENFWTLAQMYNTTMEEIEAANPDKDTHKLAPGVEVKLVNPKSLITVETIEEFEYTEAINYEVVVEKNSNMYTNEKKVKVEGERGENKITAREKKHNGILVEKEIIREEVVKKPVDKLVVQGTKERPKTVATGAFLMPTRGRLTSSYGRRWGRMHNGLDIAAPTGTPIKAADGGTVVYSGARGSFGYMVEINHGNGYVTRYAHASKLHVKVGQKVYKGQHIANVGNTGRSTGSHLHFEVLKNGSNVNPSSFVR